MKSIHLLLVEDNPDDIFLTRRAFKDSQRVESISVVEDGVAAIQFLRRQGDFATARRPDLILLDLNLPKKDGREVLAEVKQDPELLSIPIVVLTTSSSIEDIEQAYALHANCYLTKPVDMHQFVSVVQGIESFWMCLAQLPEA
ncbi:MAG: response regulator [bacterium]|nr:response regulator [bacterium]